MNNIERFMPIFNLVLELFPEERARFPEKFEVRVVSQLLGNPSLGHYCLVSFTRRCSHIIRRYPQREGEDSNGTFRHEVGMSMTDIRIEDITPQLLEMARALFREKWRRLKELPQPVNYGDFFDGLDLTGDYTVSLGSNVDTTGRGIHVRQGDRGWYFLPSEINEASELLAMSLV